MDQGVIQNLKVHYRKRVVFGQLRAIERKEEYSLNVLDALRMLKESWQCVSEKTIWNCFHHAGFTQRSEFLDENVSEDFDELDDIPLACLAKMGTDHDQLNEFMQFSDECAPTSDVLSDSDIVQEIMDKHSSQEEVECDSDEDNDHCEEIPSHDEVLEYLRKVQVYFESLDNTEDESKMLCSLSRRATRNKFQNVSMFKQCSMMDYIARR